MSIQLVIAEKPSVARSIAGVIGADQKKDGYMEGNGYLVSWCIGHLVSLADAAAYGFHHQSEDGKYLIMGNGTDAFAIPAQQESPIKAAEMTTEQNYNMIDGVLNNAPTMSELEAKAKAGEQISLFDVAEAAKAEAQKPKQPQRPAQKQKKPSIRAQLKAAKEEQQKKPPQREKAQELEV